MTKNDVCILLHFIMYLCNLFCFLKCVVHIFQNSS